MLHPHPFAIFFQPFDMYSGEVRSALRGAAVDIALTILFTAAGIGCLAIYRGPRKAKDPAMLWFGVFLIVYGLRNGQFLRIVTFLAYPVPPVFWAYFSAVLTYLLPIPAILFVREIFPGWRRVLRWFLWAQVSLLLVNIIADAVRRQPSSLHIFNNALSVLLFLAFVLAVFTLRQSTLSTRGLRLALLLFAVTIVVANLRGLLLPPRFFNPEPLGFALFLLTLGSMLATRTFQSQERLVALDRELEIARQIQASILPASLPHTASIDIAARYLPMTAVAGDFYDVLELNADQLGILVADVSGHGVPAALIASMVKVAIAAQLPHAHDPAQVLSGINQTLCGKLRAQFVTAAYLFLDLQSGLLRYSAAGHPPLLWYRRDAGAVTPLEENGFPLGLMSFATYTNREETLTRPSRFLLYTDGVAEASNPAGDFFGEERLQSFLSGSAAGAAAQCADLLLAELKSWVGPRAYAQQEDDVTVLVVDIT